jgi:glycosyltransferase involved in cell wall biosynthesis
MKKKILTISLYIPYPLSRGGDIAVYYFLEQLCNDYDITFLTEAKREGDLLNLQGLKRSIPNINIVVQNNVRVKAEPTRFGEFISKVKNFAKHLLNRTSKLPARMSHAKEVNKVIFETAKPEFAHFVLDHINANTYDFIQLEFFNTLNLLPLLPSTSKKIFVHHELYYKSLLNTTQVDRVLQRYLAQSVMCYEHALLRLADVVVVFNDDDKALLSEVHEHVVMSPFGIPASLIVKNETSSTYGKFIFLGGERHPPNREGLTWFLDTIYIPNYDVVKWPVYIVSAWSDQTKMKYSKYDRIIFTGYVEDLSTIYDGAVMITPILSGSGIRTKILQSFANMVPVLSTTFAAEGLYTSESDKHVLFFSDGESFLKNYNEVANNQLILKETAVKGYQYFTNHFDVKKLLEKRSLAYSK